MKLTASVYVSDYDTVKLSWWARLSSWPWRPWLKFKTIYSPKAYFLFDQKLIICSFDTYNKIQKGTLPFPQIAGSIYETN